MCVPGAALSQECSSIESAKSHRPDGSDDSCFCSRRATERIRRSDVFWQDAIGCTRNPDV
jgi:hypothetical protein